MTVHQDDFVSALSRDAKKLLNIGPEDLELVMKNCEVTKEDVAAMITSVREWLNKQPHMPGDKIRDQQILGHLILKSFSVEKVKNTLDDCYFARHRMPDILGDRDPLKPDVASYLKQGNWIIMPKKTPENHRVSFFRMNASDERSNLLMIKISFMLTEYRIWNDVSSGEHWILDLENVTLHQVVTMTPVMISNILFFIMSAFGAKLKSAHVINVPPFAAAVVNIFKRLMKPKLAERVFISSVEDIKKIFPKEVIPNEYGGDGGSCKDIADALCKTIQSDPWRQYFLELDTIYTDESKRLTPSPSNQLFGVNGSFRQLHLD